jgi:hypothetical protein
MRLFDDVRIGIDRLQYVDDLFGIFFKFSDPDAVEFPITDVPGLRFPVLINSIPGSVSMLVANKSQENLEFRHLIVQRVITPVAG